MEKLNIDPSQQGLPPVCNWQEETASGLAERLTPNMALVLMAGWVFGAEVCYMLVIANLPAMSITVGALTDGAILLLVISPAYFIFYRPFRNSWETTRLKQLEIRRLSHRLLASSELERRQLARNLHDEFGQILTGLQFEIQLLKQDTGTDPESARTQCDLISQQLSGLSEQVRNVSRTLRPSMLDNAGLAATLRWLIKTVSSHQPQLVFDLQIAEERRLSAQIETVIYRICQEAINNICKYSQARQVTIDLDLSRDWATLTIADDGCGFNLSKVEKCAGDAGLGLVGMRERIAYCNGMLQILTHPGEGCTICARIPLQQKELT